MTFFQYDDGATINDVKGIIALRVKAAHTLKDGDCIDVGDNKFIVRVHGVYASVVFVRRKRAGSLSPKFKSHVIINDNIFIVETV